MKRRILTALLTCLLLCGCGKPDAVPGETVTQPPTAAQAAPESIPDVQTPVQTLPEPEKVTVYLLTNTISFDSGFTEYVYDENNNIASCRVFSLENTLLSETFYEQPDANGMARVVRTRWPDGMEDEVRNLTWSEAGKLLEEQNAQGTFTGYQYAYDDRGNRTEKREYYEGVLQSVVYYEYDGAVLQAVRCEDGAGSLLFDCRMENGLITQKIFHDSEEEYGYRYEYDSNHNLIQTSFFYDGEIIPGDQYFYRAVEVDAQRAACLLEQQRYLIFIA